MNVILFSFSGGVERPLTKIKPPADVTDFERSFNEGKLNARRPKRKVP